MIKGEPMLIPCPECGSENIVCFFKTIDYEEIKAHMECDDCKYYLKWTKDTFEKRYQAENQAEEDWNDPYSHMP